jgi:hypothetical protein
MKKNVFFTCSIVMFLNSSYIVAQTGEPENENHVLCGGIERWAVKVLADSLASFVDYTPIPISVQNLVALTTPFANPYMNRSMGVENKTYKIVCNITIKKNENDNDLHLVLSDGTNTLIGELPDPACSAAATTTHVSQFIAARNFINANIAGGNVYNVNIGSVTVIGVAFIDPPHGQTGAAPNHLELHPILDIYFTSSEGINENEKTNVEVTMGPNPFNMSTSIKVVSKNNNLKSCFLKLFNVEGAEIKNLKLPVTNDRQIDYSLDKGDLKPGFYIYRIINSNNTLYEGKLVVE